MLRAPLLGPSVRADPLFHPGRPGPAAPYVVFARNRLQGPFCSRGRWLLRVLRLVLFLWLSFVGGNVAWIQRGARAPPGANPSDRRASGGRRWTQERTPKPRSSAVAGCFPPTIGEHGYCPATRSCACRQLDFERRTRCSLPLHHCNYDGVNGRFLILWQIARPDGRRQPDPRHNRIDPDARTGVR